MHEFIQSLNNIPNTAESIDFDIIPFLLMLICAFLFGLTLNFLYNSYYKDDEPMDGSLSRSLVLLTPTLMSIFWFIQYSIPLSVGLLGTLSFVRFRTPVKRAEDSAFILMALVCAISCALSKPVVCLALILILFIYSLIRNKFIKGRTPLSHFAVLTYNSKNIQDSSEIKKTFTNLNCPNYELISSRCYDGITSYVFNITSLKQNNIDKVIKSLEKHDRSATVNVFYPNGRLGGYL
jgi:hypothetical protein